MGHAVAGVRLSVAVAFAAEAFDGFPAGVEFVDELFPAAHRAKDAAIGCNCDGGQPGPAALRLVGGRLGNLQKQLPVGIDFAHS
jgi:hypothetical protein